jgi:hypothetical protein
MIDVVLGLRGQGGTLRHVGGANRTIIKLAQQNPAVNLARRKWANWFGSIECTTWLRSTSRARSGRRSVLSRQQWAPACPASGEGDLPSAVR